MKGRGRDFVGASWVAGMLMAGLVGCGEKGSAGAGGAGGGAAGHAGSAGVTGAGGRSSGGEGGSGRGGDPGETGGRGGEAGVGGTAAVGGPGGATGAAGGGAGSGSPSGGAGGTGLYGGASGAPAAGGTPGNGGSTSTGGAGGRAGAPGSFGGATSTGGGTSSAGAPGHGGGSAGAGGLAGGAGGGSSESRGGASGMSGGSAGTATAGMTGNGGASGNGGGGPGRPVAPHLLFLFDTSGSMLEDESGTWVGEVANICALSATPNANRSKLYGLKAAFRAVLTDLGTQANVGLMSFPIQTRTPPSDVATWCPKNAAASGGTGHYVPTPGTSATNLGCKMSTHVNDDVAFGPWFTSGLGEVLRAGVTRAPLGATPAASDFDPADANVPAVMRWIDDVELPLTTSVVTDPELHGMGLTPLGRLLLYARLYLENFVKPADPSAACRQNALVLITDGNETCDMTAPDSAYDLVSCTGSLNTFSELHPVNQACRLRRDAGIKTYVITHNGLSASELVNNDRIASAGGTSAAARVSLADVQAAKTAIRNAVVAATASGACTSP